MNRKPRLNLVFCALIAALAHGFALAAEATDPPPTQSPGVIHKVGNAVERGAHAAVNGIETGVKAAARGIERGATAAANGVERGFKATARFVGKVTGPSSSEAQK